jgi:hypothetical protein
MRINDATDRPRARGEPSTAPLGVDIEPHDARWGLFQSGPPV